MLALLTLVAVPGLLRLRTDVGYAAFLGAEHPAVRSFDAFLERFGGGFPIGVVWSCDETPRCEQVFDEDALQMAAGVAGSLADQPGVRRVESPATSLLLVPVSDGVEARRIVERGEVSADRAALARRALADPLWVGSLVSADGRVGAIVVELSDSDGDTSVEVFEALERTLAPLRAPGAQGERGYRFHLVGGPVDFVVAGGELRAATERLVPLVGALLAGVVWALVGSAAAVAAALGSAALAVVWTLGLLGWLGWPQNTLTQTLPPLVLVISACHGIHVLWRYSAELADGEGTRSDSLLRVARDIGSPCVITTLTTAGGFLSFATSGLESFVRFGAIAAAGVGITLLFSFSLLPVLVERLVRSPLDASRGAAAWGATVSGLVRAAERAPFTIVAGACLLGVLAAVGLPRLRVDVRYEDLYGEGSQVVRWVRFVEARLRAPETLEIEIGLPEGTRIESIEAMAHVERLEGFLPTVEGLHRVHSMLEPLRRMNRLLHEDDPRFERTGRTARENAGLLLLLGGAAPLAPWLTLDHAHVRLSVEARKVPQERLRALIAEVEAWMVAELPADWSVRLTGPAVLVREMVEEIKRTQLNSFAAAAAVVIVLVAFFLRSLRWAALAMVPTGLPVLWTLGAMGYVGIHLDVGTAMVAAVVIGIAIDDTVHLLTQYRRRREAGLAPAPAIRESVSHVARALITTSLALSLGFLSLLVSPWQSVASFGAAAAIAILMALVADLLVLPALVLLVSAGRRTL